MYQNWIKYNTKTASKSNQDCSPLLCYRFVSTALTAQIPNGNAIANLLGLLHTGKERDSETGFSYFGARYYDSDLMTGWLSMDPMADKYPGLSPYAYCGWNPVRLVDPDGRDWYIAEGQNIPTYDKNITADNCPEGASYIGKTAHWFGQLGNDMQYYYHGNTDGSITQQNMTITINGGTPWLNSAESQLGVTEIPGSRHNPTIIGYHATTTLSSKSDETPWCSSFANWNMVQCGILGTNSARALSWKDWGREINEPTYGCIGIIDWGKGKGHVGFIIGQNGNNYVMLGGNQKDAVRYSEFKKSLFTSFRYPNNYSTIGGGLPRCKATSINPSTR